MLRLEKRPSPSRLWNYATPVVAVLATMIAGGILFAALGKNPFEAIRLIFWDPLFSEQFASYSRPQLLVKAGPLILIAVGLSIGFRAGIWNIGAEGQFTMGALCGGAVALAFYDVQGYWLLPLMCLAGVAGGMAWAAVPAFLKTRFQTNEILTSLMLTYVAILLLSVLVHGPLKDPEGLNFPESRLFHDSAILPLLFDETRVHIGFLIALVVVVVTHIVLWRHIFGYQIKVQGEADRVARFAGFVQNRIVWRCLLISGGLAGLAGVFEAAGPVGQLVPALPTGYGFTAIIVAFLGRLHPVGILFGGFVMALTYIGGETAQMEMQMPKAVTSVFQGLLLFFLLGIDFLVRYRVVLTTRRRSAEG